MAVMMLSLSLYGAGLGVQGDFASDTAQDLLGLQSLAAMVVSTPVLLLLGLPLAESVFRMKRWLSADSLVLLGTGAAWLVSGWNAFRGAGAVYFDTATMVLVLVSLGRWLDLRAKERARDELTLLLPDRAAPVNVLVGQEEVSKPASELCVGERIRVRPGDVLPVDGRVLSGRSFVDSSNLTGESEPRAVAPGDRVYAGSHLVDGTLEVQCSAVGADRMCAEVDRLLHEALANPAPSVRLADSVARVLIPAVLLIAIGTCAYHWSSMGAEGALLTALSVVLIACPCSLGIATPLAYWTAIGEAWHRGVLVRGGEAMERLGSARRIWLDKTGTLTDGKFSLVEIRVTGPFSEDECLQIAGELEAYSEHPIGKALHGAWRERQPAGQRAPSRVEQFEAIAGVGVRGSLDGSTWSVQRGVGPGVVALLRGDDQIAEFELRSAARVEASEVIEELKALGLQPSILTGDGAVAAQLMASELNLPVEANLMPTDKLQRVREHPASIFVGDGLNDAAALAAASVGITVAGGSPHSMDAASINFLRPGIGSLPGLIRLSREARQVARWNLLWAFGYNGIGLLLAVMGHLTPILAAGAMVASSVAVVLHSSRLKGRRAGSRGPGAGPSRNGGPGTSSPTSPGAGSARTESGPAQAEDEKPAASFPA